VSSMESAANSRPCVAVLGMGNMGRALAQRLLAANYQISIWNRSPRDLSLLVDEGAEVLASLVDVWDVAQVVITFVANDDALRDVCLGSSGILNSPVADRLFIDMSTVSPDVSREIATASEGSGISYLRSPVSGNPFVLMSGNLTLIVSGPRTSHDRYLELLRDVGPKVLYVGIAEEARLIKLAINAGLAITTELLAELVILMERHGLDRSVLLDVLGDSVLGSPFVKYKSANLLDRDYVATFTTELLAKDLRLALSLADEVNLSLPAVQLVSDLVKEASIGYGDADFAALLPHLQRRHGDEPDIPAIMDE
jgi:3-hydroxyisobutyrate dehydrogenase-like beta-hydroxyacid dehydrogenase